MREECQRRMNEPSFPFFYGVFCEVFPGATHCGTGRARMHLFLICLYFVRRWRWWDTVNSKSGAISSCPRGHCGCLRRHLFQEEVYKVLGIAAWKGGALWQKIENSISFGWFLFFSLVFRNHTQVYKIKELWKPLWIILHLE
jgi:hypothetical protein